MAKIGDPEVYSVNELLDKMTRIAVNDTKELTSLREAVRFLNDRVREQEAALAEARELIANPPLKDLPLYEGASGEAINLHDSLYAGKRFVYHVDRLGVHYSSLNGAMSGSSDTDIFTRRFRVIVNEKAKHWLAAHPAPKETP
jgi:hypothetical protein